MKLSVLKCENTNNIKCHHKIESNIKVVEKNWVKRKFNQENSRKYLKVIACEIVIIVLWYNIACKS